MYYKKQYNLTINHISVVASFILTAIPNFLPKLIYSNNQYKLSIMFSKIALPGSCISSCFSYFNRSNKFLCSTDQTLPNKPLSSSNKLSWCSHLVQ